jgi:hypothetical protein
MYIQVILGTTSDAAGLRRQHDRWHEELAPGAKGYLGATAGVAEDGTAVVLARFESEEAAKANSDRSEQAAWWEETAKHFDGDVTFHDCADTETMLGGGSDDAGFVQVMIYERVADRQRMRELEDEVLPRLRELRPELIGAVRAWDGEWGCEAAYFTSEAEARKGEGSVPEELQATFREWQGQIQGLTFVDLKDPWLVSA